MSTTQTNGDGNVSSTSTPLPSAIAQLLSRYAGLLAHTHAIDAFSLRLLDQIMSFANDGDTKANNDDGEKSTSNAVGIAASPAAKALKELASLAWQKGREVEGSSAAPSSSSPFSPSEYAQIIAAEEFLRNFVCDYYYYGDADNVPNKLKLPAKALDEFLSTIRSTRERINEAFVQDDDDYCNEEKEAHNNQAEHATTEAAPPLLTTMPSATVYERTFHMNPKKVYEVMTMAPFIHSEVQKCVRTEEERHKKKMKEEGALKINVNDDGADNNDVGGDEEPLTVIVDIGAGQGYLSAALCLPPFNYTVIAVEREGNNCHGSLKSSQAVQQLLQKQKKADKERKRREEDEAAKKRKKITRNDEEIVGQKRSRSPPPPPPSSSSSAAANRTERKEEGSGRLVVAKLEVNEQTSAEALLKMVTDAVHADEDANTSTSTSAFNGNKQHFIQKLLAGNSGADVDTVGDNGNHHPRHQRQRRPLRIVFISLHACGSLSHQMLRLFTETNQLLLLQQKQKGEQQEEEKCEKEKEGEVKEEEGANVISKLPRITEGTTAPLLVNVGCCYNLIDDADGEEKKALPCCHHPQKPAATEAPTSTSTVSTITMTADNNIPHAKKKNHATFPLSAILRQAFSPNDDTLANNTPSSSSTTTTPSTFTITLGRDGTVPPLYLSAADDGASSAAKEGGGGGESASAAVFDGGFVLSRNMKQAACQCPARWGVVMRRGGSTKVGHDKDTKHDQEDEKDEDTVCREEVLNNFELNYQRAVLQVLLMRAYNNHNQLCGANPFLELDTRVIGKAVVRYSRGGDCDDGEGGNSNVKQLKKASERETAARIEKLRHYAVSLNVTTNNTNTTTDARTNRDNDILSDEDDWLNAFKALFVEDYSKPSCAAIVQGRSSTRATVADQSDADDNAKEEEKDEKKVSCGGGDQQCEHYWSEYVKYSREEKPCGTNPSSSSHHSLSSASSPPYRILLAALWALKAIVGEFIERTILLDRLFFLKESKNNENGNDNENDNGVIDTRAVIAQPLDPFHSPRCFAVVCRRLGHE